MCVQSRCRSWYHNSNISSLYESTADDNWLYWSLLIHFWSEASVMHLGSFALPVWPGFTSIILHLEQLAAHLCVRACVCIDPHTDLGCWLWEWYTPRGQSNYPDSPLPMPMGHIAAFVLIFLCIMLHTAGTRDCALWIRAPTHIHTLWHFLSGDQPVSAHAVKWVVSWQS